MQVYVFKNARVQLSFTIASANIYIFFQLQTFDTEFFSSNSRYFHFEALQQHFSRQTIEYVWSIFGLRRELLRTYSQSKNALFLSKNGKKKALKIPHNQGICLGVWENIIVKLIFYTNFFFLKELAYYKNSTKYHLIATKYP